MNNQQSSPTPPPNEEININDLFAKVGSFFRKLFNSIGMLSRHILNQWKFFLLLTLVGSALAYAAFLKTKPFYAYSMTVLLSNVRNDFVQNQLESLETSVNEENSEVVAQQLKISKYAASQISTIHFRSLDQAIIPQDSVLTGSPLEVIVHLHDNTIEDSVETGLVQFLEHNRLFSRKKQIRKEYLESVVAKLKQDILSIDSIKKAPINPPGPVNGFVYGEPLDPTNLYKESVELYEKQAQYEYELKNLEHFEVVVGFAPRIKPSGPKRSVYILIGILTSLTLGLIYSLKKEKSKRK